VLADAASANRQSAAILMVMLLIFPLAFTLTAFLMWIIVSLNGESLLGAWGGISANRRHNHVPPDAQAAHEAADVPTTLAHPHHGGDRHRGVLRRLIHEPF